LKERKENEGSSRCVTNMHDCGYVKQRDVLRTISVKKVGWGGENSEEPGSHASETNIVNDGGYCAMDIRRVIP